MLSVPPAREIVRVARRHPAVAAAAGLQLIALVLLAIDVTAVAAGEHDLHQLRALGIAAVTAASCAAAVLTVLAVRNGGDTPDTLPTLAWAFGLLTVGGLAGLAGLSDLVTPTGDTGLVLYDLALVTGALTVAVAVLRHPGLGPPRRRARVLVDSAIVALSLAAVLWVLGGRALAEQGEGPLRAAGIVLAIATTVAVGRTGLMIAASSRRTGRGRVAVSLVTGAAAWMALGGLLHLLSHVWPSVALQVLGDLVMVSGLLAAGVTALGLLCGLALPAVPTPRPRARRRVLVDLAPIVACAVAIVAVLADAASRGQFDSTASGMLTVVVCSVLLRQSLTLADNRELSMSLRSTVDDLEHQATHDVLTGLPNRIGLDERIDAAVASAASARTVCAVYFIDLDHLKTVNDAFGHGAGDTLIRTTAARLRARVGDRVTRFGGDEFVVVVDDLDGPAAAEQLGQQLVEDTGRPVELEGAALGSSTSVGLAVVEPGTPAAEALRRADVALYRAKALGRRCVTRYRPEEDTAKDAELDLEPELHRAVRQDELSLAYQPIIELETGRAVSVEALLRWQHPTRGELSPALFLEAAIEAGLLGAIGAASLRRACRDFAGFRPDDGGAAPSVAVNLSSSELADRRVVQRVRRALDDSGLEAARLTLEITEDVIIDDAVRSAIDELAALGPHLAIDDFGTGNSSLRQLGAYPAHVLKIDRSFVERLEHDERARAVTAAIVRLARHLGLVTVAEGVETEGQARLLAGMGCDRGQGWLFAAAMPLAELEEWWRTRTPVPYRDRRATTSSASSMSRASSSATVGRSSMAPTT